MKHILFTCYLLAAAGCDLRTKKIPVILCLGFGAAGAAAGLPGRTGEDVLFAVLPGLFSLLLTRLTGGEPGAGDGVFFLTAALYLSAEETWILWMGGLALLSFGGLCMIGIQKASVCRGREKSYKGGCKCGKKEQEASGCWKQRLPFLPFLVPVWFLLCL